METKTKADRFNTGKVEWTQLDFKALEAMVRVQMYGEKKYSRDNWKKGMDDNVILDCLLRHVIALTKGELIDPESGLPHIGHVMCNAMYFSHYHPMEEVKKEPISVIAPIQFAKPWNAIHEGGGDDYPQDLIKVESEVAKLSSTIYPVYRKNNNWYYSANDEICTIGDQLEFWRYIE